jgi:hypothetical protein
VVAVACFLPGLAKDLSAPRYINVNILTLLRTDTEYLYVTVHSKMFLITPVQFEIEGFNFQRWLLTLIAPPPVFKKATRLEDV